MQWLRNFFSSYHAANAPKSSMHSEKKHIHTTNIGKAGEEFAVNYLRKKGLHILAQNWRHKHLEIDIIAKDADTIVFVEVKTRKHHGMGIPTDAITYKKRQNLIRAANFWISTQQLFETPCRFDVISITHETQHGQILFSLEHYDNAFDLAT